MSSSDLTVNSQTILSPGRVNLLGEHVDYNDGPVLPVAIDLTLTLEFFPLSSNQIILHALDLGKTARFSLADLDKKVDLEGQPLPHFALYPAAVAWACQQAGLPVMGMEASYSSNIPIGSGLSSSAAVEVAFAQAFKTLGKWDIDRMTLVKLTQQAGKRLCRRKFRHHGSIRGSVWAKGPRPLSGYCHIGMGSRAIATGCRHHRRRFTRAARVSRFGL